MPIAYGQGLENEQFLTRVEGGQGRGSKEAAMLSVVGDL
jgi:hypothetical protein